jgi:hypothetical protein
MSIEVKEKRSIKIAVSAPAWMGSDVIVKRLHERVQEILNALSFRAPDETMEAVGTAIVDAYIAGYGDGRGILEHEGAAEAHVQRLADVLLAGEGGDDPDHFAIADMARRVAAIIEQRGIAAIPPRGLLS